MKKFVLSIFSLAFLVCSCSNNEDITAVNNTTNLTAEDYLTITYKGVTYSNVPTAYDSEGNFIFLDDVFSNIYVSQIAMDTDASIFVSGRDSITFYDNLASNLKDNKLEKVGALTRAVSPDYNNLGHVELYDDKNFDDRQVDFSINDTVQSLDVANLKNKPWRFNDKCSSIILTNNFADDAQHTFTLGNQIYPTERVSVVFIGYDDKNWSDRSIMLVADASQSNRYEWLPGFNDKLSSLKLFFAQRGQYTTKF